jgi:integrase
MRGHIRERAPGVLECIVYLGLAPGGKPRYKSKTCREGRRAAQKLLNAMLAEVSAGTAKPRTSETVADYLSGWLATTGALRLTPKSLQAYRCAFERQVIPHIGGTELDKLRPQDVEAWLVALLAPGGRRDGKAGGVSPQTAKQYANLLRIALNDAVRRGRLQKNPAVLVALPKVTVLEVEALSEAQLRRLILAASGRLRMACVLGAGLGLRRGEVCAVQWTDVDEAAGTVTIRRAVEDTTEHGLRMKPPKSGKPRTLPLPAFVATELRRWRGEQAQARLLLGAAYTDNGLVCPRDDGTTLAPNSLSDGFAALSIRLGLPSRRFHCLRHSCATTLFGRGESAKVVQEILGHASPAFTLQKYGHALPEHFAAAARRLDAALSGGPQIDEAAAGGG